MRFNARISTLVSIIYAASTFVALITPPAFADVQFRDALDDSPLDLSPIKGEVFTDQVKKFHETGIDPYNGNADAIAIGKDLFENNCVACHEEGATGGMGPSLVDDVYTNARANTDLGKFEIIHSGASGAMRSFSKRGITQDQILHLIAYINSLKK
ncbi:c-type cytochrome [Hyphomicrobium sp.]|uniref:c-type cytochrome n=1 Tax=Hyphomicrobium sp. TaxID=82 RepID=UPI000FBEE353|nr:c-type cytochrome [Hyphomicrobium sp.]RUP09190.1 MAG: c-type cytochrome [Hyphomicrobium sp.]